MSNRILRVEVRDLSVIPAQAEVRIDVLPERRTPTTEVQGRLMGPHCLYASTVEVAYPLRPLPPSVEKEGGSLLTTRVIIPEASLWEPESPFLYQGPVELWEGGQRCDQVTVGHGLRSLNLGPRGLRLNGRPLPLRGRSLAVCPEREEALAWHRAGCNLLLVPVEEATAPLWDLADRIGFLILGRVAEATPATLRLLADLRTHPCSFGWLTGPETCLTNDLSTGVQLGLDLEQTLPGRLPQGFSFVACAVSRLTEVANLSLPVLLLGTEEDHAAARGRVPDLALLGWAEGEG